MTRKFTITAYEDAIDLLSDFIDVTLEPPNPEKFNTGALRRELRERFGTSREAASIVAGALKGMRFGDNRYDLGEEWDKKFEEEQLDDPREGMKDE